MGISKNHVRRNVVIHCMYSTPADCYILKYLVLNLVQNHPGHPNIWFSKGILLQGFKMRLSLAYLGQDISFYPKQPHFKLGDVRFNCSFPTKSGMFDHLKIDRF